VRLCERNNSKIDLLLAKAEPISNSGSISVIRHLRRGKKPCVVAAREKSKNM